MTKKINEIHHQIEFQVPQFIRDDYEAFLTFMRSYYQWIESTEGPLYFLRRLLLVQDIDTTEAELLEYFYREYAPTFPRSTVLSPSVIIKNIRQFYLAKGNEKSFQFLFRVFFGQDVELYYPRLDILRTSDGKWIQDSTLKTVLLSGDPEDLIGNRIIGTKTKSSAYVERVLIVQDGSVTTYELYLNRSSIVGKFGIDEIVRDEGSSLTMRVLPVITKIKITNGGQGYKPGQEVIISGEGINSRARIDSISETTGAITSVQVYKFGSGYIPATTTVTFPLYTGVLTQATGVPVFEAIAKYPGYFLNADGMLSTLKYIQDSYYYQQFSYVIRSEESRDRYENTIKSLVHPIGFVFFSEVISEAQLDASTDIPLSDEGYAAIEMEIFTDLQHDWNQFLVPTDEYVYVSAEVDSVDSSIELSIEDTTYASDNYPLGPSWRDWEIWKGDYRPTPIRGLPNDEMLDPDYYASFANTPLKVFADVQLSEIVNNPWTSIDHLPETDIRQEEEE